MSDRQPLIILTCMRSYSSLVSAMLGQHSGLYGLPEINPFIEKNLGAMEDFIQAVRPRTLDGLLRAVAELEFGEQTEASIAKARHWLTERRDWTSVQLMSYLADRVAPKKLVDKSPSTVLVGEGIDRALRMFDNAYFLHLYRHPVSTTQSIAKITGQNQMGGGWRRRARDPENSWYEINLNIIRLSERISPDRFMSVRGEDVLRDPDIYLTQICDWLGLETSSADLAAMKQPECSPYACIGPPSAPFGNDPNFLRNPSYCARPIHEPALDGPLDWAGPNRRLKPETITLSYQLGYDRMTSVSNHPAVPRP